MRDEYEVHSVKLGDRRLNRRLAIVIMVVAAHPEASISQATGFWAEAKAPYRFVNNDQVSREAILLAHRDIVGT